VDGGQGGEEPRDRGGTLGFRQLAGLLRQFLQAGHGGKAVSAGLESMADSAAGAEKIGRKESQETQKNGTGFDHGLHRLSRIGESFQNHIRVNSCNPWLKGFGLSIAPLRVFA
jgi:hypothetical protein